MLYKIAICDDEWISLKNIENMTADILKEQHIEYEIQHFQKAKDLEESLLKQKKEYHLILMDICLGKDNGISLIRTLREQGIHSDLVYISGYDSFAMEAIETDVLRYLIKPVDREKLKEALMTAYKRGYKKNYLILEFGSETGTCKIPYDDIFYLEAYNRGTNIVTKSGVFHLKKKFTKIAEEIEQDIFCRCHYSFLVNKNKISILRKYEIILENEEVIPVSRRKYEQCKKEFLTFLI